MKVLFAFLCLVSTAAAQVNAVHVPTNGAGRRVDFNPWTNQNRTIEFDMSDGTPRVTSDVTLPEGVGYVYIYNAKTKKGIIEYSRTQFIDNARFFETTPVVAPIWGLR